MATTKNVGEQLIAKAKTLKPSYSPDKFNDVGEALDIVLDNIKQPEYVTNITTKSDKAPTTTAVMNFVEDKVGKNEFEKINIIRKTVQNTPKLKDLYTYAGLTTTNQNLPKTLFIFTYPSGNVHSAYVQGIYNEETYKHYFKSSPCLDIMYGSNDIYYIKPYLSDNYILEADINETSGGLFDFIPQARLYSHSCSWSINGNTSVSVNMVCLSKNQFTTVRNLVSWNWYDGYDNTSSPRFRGVIHVNGYITDSDTDKEYEILNIASKCNGEYMADNKIVITAIEYNSTTIRTWTCNFSQTLSDTVQELTGLVESNDFKDNELEN